MTNVRFKQSNHHLNSVGLSSVGYEARPAQVLAYVLVLVLIAMGMQLVSKRSRTSR